MFVEDEASVIGKIHIPKRLFESCLTGARFDVQLPLDEVRPYHAGGDTERGGGGVGGEGNGLQCGIMH